MGSSCQYRVPGVNSDSQMDVFRILRVAFLRSTSGGGAASPDVSDCLPLSYEIFSPDPVRHARSGPREPAERMRDTFAKVMTYLRNVGNKIVHLHASREAHFLQPTIVHLIIKMNIVQSAQNTEEIK